MYTFIYKVRYGKIKILGDGGDREDSGDSWKDEIFSDSNGDDIGKVGGIILILLWIAVMMMVVKFYYEGI